MKAQTLLSHAIRMTLRDPKATVRVTAVPYLAASIFSIMLIDPTARPESPGSLVLMVAELFLMFVGLAWMAVAWHRHILLAESGGLLPPFPTTRVAAYFGYSTAFVLIAAIAAILLISPGFNFARSDDPVTIGWLARIESFAILFAWLIIYGRLGAIMPAVAIGPIDSLFQGWRATWGATLTIAIATFPLVLFQQVEHWAVSAIPLAPPTSAILDALLRWPFAVLGVSLLTSTYMHYVQRHQLD
jgi:hypothetical protein